MQGDQNSTLSAFWDSGDWPLPTRRCGVASCGCSSPGDAAGPWGLSCSIWTRRSTAGLSSGQKWAFGPGGRSFFLAPPQIYSLKLQPLGIDALVGQGAGAGRAAPCCCSCVSLLHGALVLGVPSVPQSGAKILNLHPQPWGKYSGGFHLWKMLWVLWMKELLFTYQQHNPPPSSRLWASSWGKRHCN